MPRIEWAEAYHDELREYVVIPEETLQTKHGGFQVPQTTLDNIEYIAKKATDCELLYHNHNELIDYMSRLIGEGPTGDPKTVQAAIYKKEDELAKRALHALPLSQLESSKAFTLLSDDELSAYQRTRTPPAPGSEEDLYLQQRERERTESRSRGASQPLMRDTLPNRPQDQ